jgi:hypothetical protein
VIGPQAQKRSQWPANYCLNSYDGKFDREDVREKCLLLQVPESPLKKMAIVE